MPDLSELSDGLPDPLDHPISAEAVRMERRQLRGEGRAIGPVADELDRLADPGEADADDYRERVEALYERTRELPTRDDYPYTEPSTYGAILAERPSGGGPDLAPIDRATAESAIHGGWVGACAGCLLGKPIQGWDRPEILGFLRESGQYPPEAYLYDRVSDEVVEEYDIYTHVEGRGEENSLYVDALDHMPIDDDIDYVVVGLGVLEEHGRDFEPLDVANYWLGNLPAFNTYTAERAAYINLCNKVLPPESARRNNPYREHVGALIRADAWGYVSLGDPEAAAELAFRDASISHVRNGIYGEMWAAAAIAAAPVAEDRRAIVEAALAEIPEDSRLAERLRAVLGWHEAGADYETAVERIHDHWDETDMFDWVHTIPNAEVVAVALLWGDGEFTKTISRAITAAFDTDSHGATVGSIVGAHLGIDAIPGTWTDPLQDTLDTSIVEFGTSAISDLAAATAEHWRPPGEN